MSELGVERGQAQTQFHGALMIQKFRMMEFDKVHFRKLVLLELMGLVMNIELELRMGVEKDLQHKDLSDFQISLMIIHQNKLVEELQKELKKDFHMEPMELRIKSLVEPQMEQEIQKELP